MAKYTQKMLREFVRNGIAIDASKLSNEELYDIARNSRCVGLSRGIYGMNGGLFRHSSGKLYAVTTRNTALFILA